MKRNLFPTSDERVKALSFIYSYIYVNKGSVGRLSPLQTRLTEMEKIAANPSLSWKTVVSTPILYVVDFNREVDIHTVILQISEQVVF